MVPDRGADTETFIRTFEVMLHVIELDELEVSSFDVKVMGSVMSQVIDEVSSDKSGKYGCKPLGCSYKLHQNEIKEAVEEQC